MSKIDTPAYDQNEWKPLPFGAAYKAAYDLYSTPPPPPGVSQPVKAWKGRRADTEPAGRFS